ncbi:hypothetical protein GGX14DRAFT_412507 [Mycena pura]|uniref:Uncharacterized protein n=1 Tax=Mycena pura TaxID=153505 RepID=A0AAD6YSD0_9AGAR|nr:hypothetical protein GGX14DRAFT_412507 [Mycena pura]
MDYEFSDILGSSSLPVRNPRPAKWPGFSKIAFYLALLAAAYVGAVRAWDALLKWREKAYRLSMRRRHGIPDHDHRPFNVAYAAVLRARREEEIANNKVHRVDVDELYAENDRRHAATVESDIRQRNSYLNPEPSWLNVNIGPSRFNASATSASSPNNLPTSSFAPNFAERYNPNPAPTPPVVRFADQIEDVGPRRSSLNIMNSPRKHQKRALEEHDVESDVPENPKKTRVEGDEFIDGDEDAEWLPSHKRGEKRVLREDDAEDDDDGNFRNRRPRGKRARKVNIEKEDALMTSDEDTNGMDVDEEVEWNEAPTVVRGKKRDAGSSFGGEEEGEAEVEDRAQKTKRKRRSMGKRKSDAIAQLPSRDQKRDRDVNEDGSEDEAAPGTPMRSSRKPKKRGKKNKEVREVDEGSVDDDSGKRRRSIGEQWDSNGVVYKIGPKGERLRQALVKKAARRFVMPLDSQHPDKNANLEVCIETWLTEEDYQDFKSRHLLAWQDSPNGTQEPESGPSTPVAVADTPSTPTPTRVAKGKNLLWDSPASPFPVFAPSPAEKEQFRPAAHFRQSIAADLGGVRVNPFEKANVLHVGTELVKAGSRLGRRVGAGRETMANPGLPGLADSTNSMAQVPFARRTFSKWEKQDLEAKAMMRMREASQAKIKEKELKEKELKEKLEKEKAAAAAPVPIISLTAPPAEPAKAHAPPFSFAPPTSSATATPSAVLPAAATGPPKLSFGPAATSEKQQQLNPNLFAPPASGGATATLSKPPEPAPAAKVNPFAPPTASTTTIPSFSFPSMTAATATTPVAAKAPGPTVPATSGNPAPTPGTRAPTFSFAPPTQNPALSGGQTTGATGQGQSLLARLGGDPKPAEASTRTPPTFSFKPADQSAASSPFAPPQQQNKPADAPPTFSFRPADPAAAKSAFAAPQQPKPANAAAPPNFSFKPADPSAARSAFAPPPQPKPADQSAAHTPSAFHPSQPTTTPAPASDTAPKFSFSFGKPAASSPATSSSLTGALGSSESKAPSSALSFASPLKEDKQTFGPSTASAPASAAGESGQNKPPLPTTFNFAGSGGGAVAPSAFTSSSSPATFGTTTPSAFGGGAAQSAFTFGPKPTEEASKTTTGAPASSSGPASAPAFNFGFGANNNTSTTPAGSPAPNPFDAKPSAFGGQSIFGKPAASTEVKTATTPQASGFSFGTGASSSVFGQPSAFGGSGVAAPSVFGTKPEAAASPSAFGAPATWPTVATGPGAFGFGAPPAGEKK